ncbi:hypothetical protein L211DRAFT_845066 [Terfezia boudieri ATCC MYA-4762]|uniref:Uncharacterized protein n=1 Tax=Terfezia boudieri ATCC MYA-4762 TaxID=1051890 RepID=A0A3N4M1Y1_9PEZI|nr:hypothetical protein L211DRAFT_845066 [Terfezia boudieri ATCC MYA-4762]
MVNGAWLTPPLLAAPHKKQRSKAKPVSQPPTTAPAAEVAPAQSGKGQDRPETRNPSAISCTATALQVPDLLPNADVPRELKIDGWVQPVMAEGIPGKRLLRLRNSQPQTATMAPVPVVVDLSSATMAKGKGKITSSASASKARKGKGQGNNIVKGESKSQNKASLETPDSQPPAYHGIWQPSAPQGVKEKAPAMESTAEPVALSAQKRKHEALSSCSSFSEVVDRDSQLSHDLPKPGGKRQKSDPQPQTQALSVPVAPSKKGKGKSPTHNPTPVTNDLLPPALSTRFGANKRGIMFPVRCEVGQSSASAAAAPALAHASPTATPAILELPAPRRSSRTRVGARPSPEPALGPLRVFRSRPTPPPVIPVARVIKKPSTLSKSKKEKGINKGKGKAPRSPPFGSRDAINKALIDAKADLLIEMACNALGKEFAAGQKNLTPKSLRENGVAKRVFGGRVRDPLFRQYRGEGLGTVIAEEEAGENELAGAADELQGEALADWIRAGAENSKLHQQWTTLNEPDSKGYRLGDNERARGMSPTAVAEEEEDDHEEVKLPPKLRSQVGGSHHPPSVRGRSRSQSTPPMSPWSKGCFEECTQLG